MQHLRRLTRDDVTITLKAEQDDLDVRGNAMASGDDAFDLEVENEILNRLETGDVWAWAHVAVTATWNGFSASNAISGCSYANEADFTRPGWYYDDMVSEAIDRLNADIAATYSTVAELLED